MESSSLLRLTSRSFLPQFETELSSINFKRVHTKFNKTKIFSYIKTKISNLFFLWSTPILNKANFMSLKPSNIGNIAPSLSAKYFLNEILPVWKETINKRYSYPLFKSILSSNSRNIIIILIWSIIKSILDLFNVYLFRQIILNFKENPGKEPTFNLCSSISGMLCVKLLGIFITRQRGFWIDLQGKRTVVQINALIYDKLLKISTFNKDTFSEGEWINFIQGDSEKFSDFLSTAPNNIMLPFQIVFYFIMLIKYFGFSCLFGLLLMVVLMSSLSVWQKRKIELKKELLKYRDERMKITSEVFYMLKIIKWYSWEDEFTSRILREREKEWSVLKEIQKTQIIINTAYWSSSTLIAIVCISLYTIIYGQMEISNILTAWYIFNAMSEPLFNLPGFISVFFDTFICMKRIEKFWWSKNNDTDQWFHLSELCENAVQIKKLNFGIENQDSPPTKWLSDITLNIKKGELIGIVGDVGSGKTCLLNAIMNNWDVLNKNDTGGNIQLYGDISYISQNPWILNDTFRNNILFFNEMDEDKYNKVLNWCELEEDLKYLPGGDLSELGEKGLNLSGGQKARIAIARALYGKGDVFLFDDPLSALDVYVGTKIFNNVINGLLKNKTRILVTHAIQYIHRVDRVVYMKDGRIEKILSVDKEMKRLVTNNNNNNVNGHVWGFSACETWSDVHNEKEIHHSITSVSASTLAESPNENNWDISIDTRQPESESDIKNTESMNNIVNSNKQSKNKYTRLTKDEQWNEGSIKYQIWVKYFEYIGGCSFWLFLWLANILWKSSEVGSDYFVSNWTTLENVTQSDNFKYLFIYCFISLASSFFVYLRAYLTSSSVIKYSKTMHDTLLFKWIKAPINLFHDTIPRGQILNRMSKDLSKANKLCWATNAAFRVMFQLLSSIFVCLMFNWYSLVILPVLLFIELKITKFYISGARDLNRLEGTSRSPIISVFSETIPGISTIRARNFEDNFKDKFYYKLDTFYKICYFQSGTSNWFGLTLNLVSFTLLLVILVFAVLFKNKLSPRSMGLLLSYSIKLIDYLFTLLSRLNKLEKQITCVERCVAFTDIIQEREGERENDMMLRQSHFPENGKVQFKNYTVKYRPETPIVINKLSITFEPKQKIGVVGRTGSGKSTLTLALFRILEAESGGIFIDDINISTIGLKLLRESITIIPQEPAWFEASLKENIDPLGKYTDSEIVKTLTDVGLGHWSHNLDILIEENGNNWSIGEKQLICISRAILRKSKIVVMDEATSSIDYSTEESWQIVVNEKWKESTVITIAHRIKTIMKYDKIMVLSQGNLVEFDTPGNLLKNTNSIFYELYHQSK